MLSMLRISSSADLDSGLCDDGLAVRFHELVEHWPPNDDIVVVGTGCPGNHQSRVGVQEVFARIEIRTLP